MNARLKTLFSVSSVIILTAILHYVGWLWPIENFLETLIKPGSQALYSISINMGDKNLGFPTLDEFKQSYIDLDKEVSDYKMQGVENEILREENEILRKQLDFKTKNEQISIGAEVIGKNIDPLGNTIILNRGEVDGIKENYPVIIGSGILIGKVIKAGSHTSIVRLINDNQSKIAATILNTDKSIGLVEGGYGISVRMNYIPQNENVQVGETIITSGLEELTPKGLIIGTIEAVEKEAYQPFQRAILRPSANLEKISLVSIIKTAE